MTNEDFREALKWSLIAAVIVALWCGVLAVRKARAAIATEPGASDIQKERAPSRTPSEDIRPIWVIVVYEVRNEKLIGITEFVFASYGECQKSAAEARKELGLHLKPVCYLRWMKMEGVSKGSGI